MLGETVFKKVCARTFNFVIYKYSMMLQYMCINYTFFNREHRQSSVARSGYPMVQRHRYRLGILLNTNALGELKYAGTVG